MQKKGVGEGVLVVGKIILPIVACIGALFLPWWGTLIILVVYFFLVRNSLFLFIVGTCSGLLYDVLFWSGRGSKFSFFIHTLVFLVVAIIVYSIRKYTRVFE